MELEEAIKVLKNLEDGYYKDSIDKAIERVLQELDTSISKDIIREKINERQFELQQEYKDFEDDIRLNTLQELYYWKED